MIFLTFLQQHENLCKFPSDFFYDGKLKTANEVRARKPDKVTWPNGDSYPFEFYHVEGIEESLVVSTDQGNENSKKNQKEVNKVVMCIYIWISHYYSPESQVQFQPTRFDQPCRLANLADLTVTKKAWNQLPFGRNLFSYF